LLVAAGALAYWNYAGKKHVSHDLAEMTEQIDEVKESLEKAEEERDALKEQVEKLEPRVREVDALKAAFANGVVLQDVEALYKAQKSMSTERQAGLAALRMITNGANDPETVAAFQKALDMSEWGNRLQTVCAAQNALAAAGQKVQVLSDCKPAEKAEHGGKKEEHGKKRRRP